MARNTPEWTKYGKGEWNYTVNQEFLDGFWTYGAERAKGLETLVTVGMRGDGDLPLPGASIERLKKIIDDQRQIISKANDGVPAEKVPQVFALYKVSLLLVLDLTRLSMISRRLFLFLRKSHNTGKKVSRSQKTSPSSGLMTTGEISVV